MIIGITGSTGFIGQVVSQKLCEQGDRTILFSRRERGGSGECRRFSLTDPLDVSGCEGIVHLAGESVMGLWTSEKRRRILGSRIEGTRRLVEGIASAAVKPRVLVSASAIGFYGDTGEAVVDEESPAGDGFLAEVARAWEAEAMKAEALGVRVVRLRIGFVLGRGGAFGMIGPVFRIGLGGRLGSGRQWMSCIAVEDLASMIVASLRNETLSGAVNAVMPEPVTNAMFTRIVARAVHRPALIPVPVWGLRLALGDLSHLVLDSQRVVPGRFAKAGFSYRYASVESAVGAILRPSAKDS